MGMLDGKVAVITGAGRGIGRAEALCLAAEGAAVVVNDLGSEWTGDGADERPAALVVEEIAASGGRASANFGSVASFADAEQLVQQAIDDFGRLDILVNNAGILRDRMIFNLEPDDFDAVVSVHLKGHYNTLRHACAYWRSEHKMGRPVAGRMVNTSSPSGVFGMAGQTSYAAAKAGIAAMTQVVSMEMGRYGVTVNAICPTARTRLTEQGGTMGGEATRSGWDLMDPENVAPLVAFLASDAASDISGHVFGVFGGVVQRYDGWRPGPLIERAAGGPWDPRELAARKAELFEGSTPMWVSPMAELGALIEASRARLGARSSLVQ